MGRQGPLIVVFAMMVTAGVIVATGFVRTPVVYIPIGIEGALLLAVTALVIRGAGSRKDRVFLWQIALVALFARVSAMLLIYGVLDPGLFASDHFSYQARGQEILDMLDGLGGDRFRGRLQVGYEWINGLFAWALGGDLAPRETNFGPVVLNTFAGVWTALVAWALGRETFGDRAGRVAGALVAVFPSLVLWSVLNIRDSLATLLIGALVLVGVHSYKRVHLRHLVAFAIGALLLTTLRDYMGFLLFAGLALGYALAARPGRLGSTLVMGTIVVLGGFFMLERFELLSPEVIEDPFASAAAMRQGLQQDFAGGMAGSAYATDIDTSTLGGALVYLPLGLVYFLFAPFPWAISSPLQVLTLPETLLWYALAPFAVLGIRDAVRRDYAQGLLILGVIAISVSSYALVEGTFGTAYRHRSQFLPLFFVFAAQGLARVWERRKQEREERARRAAEARAALLRPGRR